MDKGFIPISRKLFEHPFWKQRREFSRAEAWIDLIQKARYSEGEGQMMLKDKIVKWERGQLIASTRYLKERWNWKSNTKVENFIKLLENEDMIKTDTVQKIRRITICKYDTYNQLEDAERTHNEPKQGRREDAAKTQQRRNSNKDNKENKGKKERNIIPPQKIWIWDYTRQWNWTKEDCAKFFDHHEARGWILSNGKKARDWQAMCRTWESNKSKFENNYRNQSELPINFTGKARIYDYRNE